MASRNNILLFQRIVPKYRIPVFKNLYDKAGVIVCYSDSLSKSSLNSAEHLDFPSEKLKRFFYSRSSTAVVQNPLPVLLRYKPQVVISEGAPSYLTLWLLLFFRFFFRYKLIVWSHGVRYDELDSPFKSIHGKVRLLLFNLADAVILYSEKRKAIVASAVKNPQKVFVAWNTMDTSVLLEIQRELSLKGKENTKREINWSSKFNLIYVGRFLKSKRLDILIELFNPLSDKLDVSLHIIGDGPESEFVKKASGGNGKIHIYGSLFDDSVLGKYIYCSDLMVIPGDVGLSVIHSFSFGCPIITCERSNEIGPCHGPEIEYLTDGYTGYMVKSDPLVLAEKIEKMLSSPTELSHLSENALKTVKEKASLSRMTEGFMSAIEYVKAL